MSNVQDVSEVPTVGQRSVSGVRGDRAVGIAAELERAFSIASAEGVDTKDRSAVLEWLQTAERAELIQIVRQLTTSEYSALAGHS